MQIKKARDEVMTRRWARFRFQVIGPLLAAPPEHGALQVAIAELAKKAYQHPTTGEVIHFGASTIERWLYVARDAVDPVVALARKVPSHAGTYPSMPARLAAALEAQYQEHPGWSFQLHHDNLVALARQQPELGSPPSYPTTRRYMRHRGWLRHRRKPRLEADVHEARETRSFEVRHVHGMWHLDFHDGSRKVLTPAGVWKTPQLLGILDDRSRLCCHLQWYLDETAETLVHGLSQAIQKRGLPRALLTDNGAAMVAAETQAGLERLGIIHHTTLPYTPEQNAKQEVFWAQIEGRLLPMLEGETELTLELLNRATQAWVEGEYQQRHHSELGMSPVARALDGPTVVRPSPSSAELRRAFRFATTRTVRRSDATLTVGGVRFELPWRYRTLTRVTLKVARWDLSTVDLVDPRTGDHLTTLFPLDKERNADGRRRVVVPSPTTAPPLPSGIAPHLRRLMADYAATGLPPAYVPKHDATAQTDDVLADGRIHDALGDVPNGVVADANPDDVEPFDDDRLF